jgi:hypothetical protein
VLRIAVVIVFMPVRYYRSTLLIRIRPHLHYARYRSITSTWTLYSCMVWELDHVSVLGRNVVSVNHLCTITMSYTYLVTNQYYVNVDSMTHMHACYSKPHFAVAILSHLNVWGCSRPHINSQHHNLPVTPCVGRNQSLWPGSAQVVLL